MGLTLFQNPNQPDPTIAYAVVIGMWKTDIQPVPQSGYCPDVVMRLDQSRYFTACTDGVLMRISWPFIAREDVTEKIAYGQKVECNGYGIVFFKEEASAEAYIQD